ncbi:MAG: alpha-mannosidase [Acidimicrobiales bacterium]
MDDPPGTSGPPGSVVQPPLEPGAPPRRIAVVPHTHWDREWYDPFQTFRLKLVRLIDTLLDLMERDSSYTHFLLDGQLAVVDDYLEIRPEHRHRLQALAAAGRISVGPWYILMDEFLVSGETIVRNLQAGIQDGSAFGGVMEVGYLPDMFGHVAQMPQILSLAGFEHAVVWRGVPSEVDRTAFRWHAPDGSTVRAEYLVAGYGNGAALPEDAKALVRRLRSLSEEFAPFLGPGDPLLLMNGTDHQPPQPWLGRVVAEANQIQSEFELTITSLADYLEGAPDDGLPDWHGELRSGARSNLLMGVGSNRVDVKQAAARAERALERMAEPLSALFLPADAWPEPSLRVAWTEMIRNAAHDSICACSIDDVVDAVLHRYAEARHIGQGLADEALAALSTSMADPGPVVVNPCPVERGGMVEVVEVAVGEPGPDVQVLSERAGLPGTITLNGATVRSMLGLIQGARIDNDTYITDVSMAEDDTGVDITIVIGTDPRAGVRVEEIKRELFTLLTTRPDTEVRITLDQPPSRRILARQTGVPGFGWARFSPAPLVHPVRVEGSASGTVIGNGLVTVAVDAAAGTFSVNGIPGFGQLIDGGDHGDTYNYSPPAVDTVVDRPDSVSVTVGDRGPVRATVTITSTFTWPDRVDESTRSRIGGHPVPVETRLEVRADESAVRVCTRFVNPSRDHRLRVRLPLPAPAATSHAESAFTVVERGLVAEGRAEEVGTPTFPSRRFVSSGGLTVVHEGLLEYELVDLVDGDGAPGRRATALMLTLLRATGMLSRMGMTTRPMTAGPMIPLEGPQMIGPVAVDYAIELGEVDPYRLADDVTVPLAPVVSFGGGWRPDRGSELVVRGAEVSAVRRQAGRIEVRIFNPRSTPTSVEIPGRSGWLVDLLGRPVVSFEGHFDLRAQGIATARLDGI